MCINYNEIVINGILKRPRTNMKVERVTIKSSTRRTLDLVEYSGDAASIDELSRSIVRACKTPEAVIEMMASVDAFREL